MTKKRFSFDDTIEYDKEELKPNNDLYQFDPKDKFVFNDDDDQMTESLDHGDNDVKKDTKKKKRIKWWLVVLLALIAIVLVFVIYIFAFAGNSDGPVYGERCASLLSIDKNKLSEGEAAMEADERINDVSIEVNCRTIKITYTFVDNISSNDAMALTESSLHTFDDTMGQAKDEDATWSKLFNKANGRMQYDVDIILKSNGDSNFPIFGVKHAGVDTITYTGQNVKDQESTDKAIKRQAEVDAANEAAKQSN
ncbi:MAG: hypothetical protein ACI4SR_02430 [Faecalibacillus sp.]